MISQARQLVALAASALLCAAVAGCASSPTGSGTLGGRAAAAALEQVGTPYRYGGSTPAGFDCSGLVQYAYTTAGLRIPRTTAGQWEKVPAVGRHDVEPGDLLFFRIDGKMAHVGMYVGDGRFVHAPSTGRRVAIEDLDSRFYSKAFIRAGRPR